MTERDHGEGRDYPDGSVGRYVREMWGAVPTPPAQAARPYVPPVEPPASRAVPPPERGDTPDDADEPPDVWAYHPDNAWPHGGRTWRNGARPETAETDHTDVEHGRSMSHDPFAGVEYGSDTWAAASGDEAPDERHPHGDALPPPPHGPTDGLSRDGAGEPTFPPARGGDPNDGPRRSPRGPAEPSGRGGRDAVPDLPGTSRGGRGGVGNSADMSARGGVGDPADVAARDGRGGVGEAGRPVRRGGVGDPADMMVRGGAGDHADASLGGAHGGVGDPADMTTRGHLGVAGTLAASTAAGSTPDPASPAPHPGVVGDPGRGGYLGAHDLRPGASGEQGVEAGPAGRSGRGTAGEPRPVSPSEWDRQGVESAGAGVWSGPPTTADDSVTTRTSPAAPNRGQPAGSMPPGARSAPAGPIPAVPPAEGPHSIGVPPAARVPGARPRTAPRDVPHWTDPVAVAAQEAQRARSPERTDLSSARLLRNTKRPPQSGWRRMVYVLSGRMFNPGESPTDVRRRELTARVNQPLLGCYKIAMLSLKGGVGKTTMTATLGATFASLRGDRVVAVDANPDRGTLSQKIPLETSATVRNLLRDAQRVRRYTDVRAYTSQGPSRLEVLASEQDPAVSEAYSEEDYRRTVNLLEHFYNIVLTDCGTGLMHSAMYGVLGVADQLVIVSSGSIDGARSASATMDWLDAHGHGDLVANAVVVINFVHRSRGGVDLDRVSEHFAARCRAVVRIPFDAHLEEGAEIDLDRLEPGTRMALLDLAANVADAFERAHSL